MPASLICLLNLVILPPIEPLQHIWFAVAAPSTTDLSMPPPGLVFSRRPGTVFPDISLAEGEGFEPPAPEGATAFKTVVMVLVPHNPHYRAHVASFRGP